MGVFFAQMTLAATEPSVQTDPSSVTLALKVVEFVRPGVEQVYSREKLRKLVNELNSIYSSCQIDFQVEQHHSVKPEEFGLPFHLSSVERMREVRRPFDDPRYLVVINTGSWDHKKMGAPNAWTAMPGENPSGAVLESSVSTFAGIVAHEIGHYLSLSHIKNAFNLMNPIIYAHSSGLTPDQCKNMRSTAFQYRRAAIRQGEPVPVRAFQYEGGKPTANLSAAYSG
jgi:hypothetical protein